MARGCTDTASGSGSDITRRWSGPRRRYTSLPVGRRACAAAAAQRHYVMRLRAPPPTLDYSSTRRPLPWRRLAAVVVLLGTLFIVAVWYVRRPGDILTAKQPWDGRYVQRDTSGRVVQETLWRQGKLVSAWEFTTSARWVDGRHVVDPPVWTQVVKNGNGSRTLFDLQGKEEAFERYIAGNYDGGGH
jgi:hypothetical protein